MTTDHPIVWTDERVAQFWDYESQRPENYFTYQFGGEIVRRVGRYLSGRNRILDFGCGTGYLIPHLLQTGATVTGLEYSPQSIERANETYKTQTQFNGAFLPDDLLSRPERFDAILVIEVIEHLTDRYLTEVFEQITTLLSPDGIVIVTTPHAEDLSRSLIRCLECAARFHRWQHVRSWTQESLARLLETTGFRVLEMFATNFSVSWRKDRVAFAVRLLNLVLRRPIEEPHLVCIAQKGV